MVTGDRATAVLTASAWLTLLGTIALSQSVTFDYDRTASFSTYRRYAWLEAIAGAQTPSDIGRSRARA
jgi:hypothetical protein